MIVLFAYVFGSAISLPGGGNYREFLMPGIFMQAMALTAVQAAVAVAQDMQDGIIDRFRSLPIARSAVLAGRNLSDLSLRVVGLAFMVGLAIPLAGWRTHNGLADTAAGLGLVILFGFAMIWVGTLIGLSVRSATLADQATFAWLFPMTFLANTFVPTQGLPSWLRPVADWNPMSSTVAAMRHLFGTRVRHRTISPGRCSTRSRPHWAGRCCSWWCSSRCRSAGIATRRRTSCFQVRAISGCGRLLGRPHPRHSDQPAAVAHQLPAGQLVDLSPGLDPLRGNDEERVRRRVVAGVPVLGGERVGQLDGDRLGGEVHHVALDQDDIAGAPSAIRIRLLAIRLRPVGLATGVARVNVVPSQR